LHGVVFDIFGLQRSPRPPTRRVDVVVIEARAGSPGVAGIVIAEWLKKRTAAWSEDIVSHIITKSLCGRIGRPT
jgi:hypothetical protein